MGYKVRKMRSKYRMLGLTQQQPGMIGIAG